MEAMDGQIRPLAIRGQSVPPVLNQPYLEVFF